MVGQYVVIARRYRPQTFEELVGQEHVARAMAGAIRTSRVGHAYLFTGARGVGKTSAARILAKALNCEQGPTPTPCNGCDVCRSVSTGDDVDVLEIDGASNRGVDEIRQLRQNVAVRPSRARYKIYIIDEVHMLTREAFNALLKTLEEPPEHVKFIFCTTEPEKVPVTIHSRCQRFDFAGIETASIVRRLEQICQAEGVEAQTEALELIARRAGGSMRDSQSLLEQVLACTPERLTPAEVHALLGTAAAGRVDALVDRLVQRDAAGVLAELDAAAAEGVDVGQLLEQLLGYLRDVMATAVGCDAGQMLHTTGSQAAQVRTAAERLGLETILAALQILEQSLARLRVSTHVRTLAEMALVRICKLEDLEELTAIAAELRSGARTEPATSASPSPADSAATRHGGHPGGQAKLPAAGGAGPTAGGAGSVIGGANPTAGGAGGPSSSVSHGDPTAAEKKTPDREPHVDPPGQLASEPVSAGMGGAPRVELSDDNAESVWRQALSTVREMVADNAAMCDSVSCPAPDRLVARFRPQYNSCKLFCERPEQHARLQRALAEVVGGGVRLQFELIEEPPGESRQGDERPIPPRQLKAEKARHPLVRKASELFDAVPFRVETPDG
jgi:DNA polymerase III subunit gamma/tau